ncbi:ATP-binding cassette domain-containing protein [Roseovarius sp. SCSIO 43702]|uniref:ATP-binding cassette domain-containing protein n=1 Tax=Roseovarius sp. SCSIO 43702 TaxID=2823043 RepID=UPI001C73B6AD|nr:ATP-binding cassette domain-containing protein [Roseovarius sp. SCSIO 43702]QYX55910.1 ATP-binding cassette domain-containing protein [Roseovarius sp. SCSIO 43702]
MSRQAPDLFPLVARGAVARVRGRVIVGPIDLELGRAGVTVVIGPNGAGKTTLLKMLHGIARVQEGEVRWACPEDEARARQGFVFQTPVMLRRSVRDNIAYPLRLSGLRRAEARARAEDWATRVGLGNMISRPAPVLSGGERQKLALARALIGGPDVLFLDEPTASLDGRATREIEEILVQARAGGTRLIMSTHDMGQARRLADDVLFVRGGRIEEHAAAQSFFTHPQSPQARAFLKGDIVE